MVPPGVAEGVQLRLFFPYFLGLLLLAPLLFYWLARSPRRLPPRWRRLLLGLRLATFVLLVAALLRLVLAQAADQANVVFLLDMSHSVATAVREQALEFIRAVSRAKRPRDGVGLVVFGAEAALEHAVSHSAHFTEVASEVEGTSTNIAAALRLGLASFPPRGARRLVLLSDGNENVESALEAAVVAGSLGAPVFPVPLAPLAGDAEVRAEKLVVPPQVAAGAPYQVEAVVSSTHETPASLELFRGGVFVGRHEVVLQPGKNRFSFRQQTDEEGVHLFELVVNSARDTVADNNRWQAFTEVVGPPKVLVLYEQPEHAGYLVEALRQQGLAVETRPWSDLPHALSGYLRYDALIFDNVPGFGISVSQMEILERYVRDMGGGLLMVGGEKSFGAGGYYRTPLEKVLPVDMDVPTKMSIPSLCLVMVIDRSDSMGGSVDGGNGVRRFDDRTTKLEVAKIAAFSALKLLNPFDQVGLLAFNADWEWTVPISEAGRREQIAGRLSALTHGGGTDLYKALAEGIRALKEVQAVKKHLIALSDGLTPNMDFEALLRDAAAHHITVTTVAVGKDADRTLMAAIAHWGNGRSYYTDDPLHIPRIFTAETMLVARELIEEQPFQPVLQREHEILQGLALAQLPPLYGYIVTYGKPAAEILLATPKGDPLLAVQRYGLGRTAAFTADLSARWGREWVRWPQFPRFAAQLVRWLQRKVTTESFEVRVDVREGHGVVQADVYDAANRFVNHLQLQGRLLTPQHETLPVAFTQVAPGRYRGQFPLRGNGDYLLTLVGTHNGTTLGPKTVGVAVPYSPEYLGLDTNYGLLNRLAERTGGQVLRLDAPQEAAAVLFASSGQDFTTLQDLWPWLVLVALGFFIAEIVVRQVIMATRGEEAPGSSSEPAAGYTYPALMEVVHRRTADRRRWRRS